jgi:chemotaxis protein CheC
VTARTGPSLTGAQREAFRAALHHGATEASAALRRWIGRPTSIGLDAVDQAPVGEATRALGSGDEPACLCVAGLRGPLSGMVGLAFDDAGGLALADALLGRPPGTAGEWGEMERSAALETTNIVCCAYLNAVARVLPRGLEGDAALLPTPPEFHRDYGESLLEFLLMDQLVESDQALLAHTELGVDGSTMDWTLLLIPDAPSMARLSEALPGG